jgi:hypothetical protein
MWQVWLQFHPKAKDLLVETGMLATLNLNGLAVMAA